MGRELVYSRNATILRALEQIDTVDKFGSASRSFLTRLSQVSLKLLTARKQSWSTCVIGFFGQPLVFPARLRWKGPLILDAFLSTYDTLCFDRQLFKPRSLRGRLAFYLDLYSCRQSDIVILDTRAQAKYFKDTFGIPESKLRVLHVGCDNDLFRPLSAPPADVPTVLFYGSFAPLQGIDVIIRAAQLMSREKVRFQIVGKGQESKRIYELARELKTPNIEFLDPVPLEQLPEFIARSTVCLGGHFGHSDKARRVIAGKTFQCLACAKPTIVGDNPANRELFTHGENVWMCEMNDPTALASAIRHLLSSPQLCKQIGENGRTVIEHTCGNAATLQSVRKIVESAMAIHKGSPSNDS